MVARVRVCISIMMILLIHCIIFIRVLSPFFFLLLPCSSFPFLTCNYPSFAIAINSSDASALPVTRRPYIAILSSHPTLLSNTTTHIRLHRHLLPCFPNHEIVTLVYGV